MNNIVEPVARVLIKCLDHKGLVYNISKIFFDMGLNIETNQEYVDKHSGWFFMRTVVSGNFEVDSLKSKLLLVLPDKAKIKILFPTKKKIVLMVTKESHCLGDILTRELDSALNAEVVAVISNHTNLSELTQRFDLPFYHIDATALTRTEHETKVIKQLELLDFDYIILAKYMRILSETFVDKYKHKIINIHHSFLPSFIGANPYNQAWERGVKLIGATAHFVTNELDEGPIIAQDVVVVSHRDTWKDMQNYGQDVEKIVLVRALKLVFSDKVFICNNKTIIL